MTIQRKLDDLANTTARALDGDSAAVAHVAERLRDLSSEERAQLEARAIARKVPMPAPDNLIGGGANLRILRGLCQPPGDLDGEDLDFGDGGWGHSPPKGDPFTGWVTPGPAPALLPDGSPHPYAGRDSEAEAREQRERRRRRSAEFLDQWNRLEPRDRDLSFLEIVKELARKPGTRIIDEAEKERMIEPLHADFRRGAIGEARSLADPDRPFTPADMIEAERLPIAAVTPEEAKKAFRLYWVFPLSWRRDAVASYFRAYGIPWPSAWGPAPAIASQDADPPMGQEGSRKTEEQGGDSADEISRKKRPGKSPDPYYVPFRNWLLPQYISGHLSIDDKVAPAVPGRTAAWGRHCEATKVPEAARPLPKERRLREVIRKIRDEARAAKGD